MIEYVLRIGDTPSGVTVRQDGECHRMWRIHRDELVSDMVNLSRAKDAAVAWARPRGLGSREKVYWDRRETALISPPMRETDDGLPK